MKSWKIFLVFVLVFIASVTAYAQEGKIQITWQNAEDAVLYEVEIANVPLKNNRTASQRQLVYQTTEVATPGMELSLSLFGEQKLGKLFYRVRPLDLDKKPIANFSRPIALNKGAVNLTKPTPTSLFNSKRPVPLYPVYSWIPVLGATRYEVEITNRLPENPNGSTASQYRVRSYSVDGGFDCYDQHAYIEAGTYYWRVCAFDSEDNPIGTYSDAIAFKVKVESYKWAVFGDSITHGGGAISNPPADERFDYSAYLPFPVKNLGKSGDTAQALVERFESEVLPFKPKYLFILGGSNSIRAGVSADSVISSLQTIKEKCEDNEITPIFLTLPPVNPERIQRVFNQSTVEDWQTELQKVNAYLKLQPNMVDIYPFLVDRQGILPVKYAEDGLHPDISGKKIMARAINVFLKRHYFH